ncbi:uncharacterized protein LOC111621023 [Centruroides sculpturatus]|uniref:uncharacterized protein LOC111621023 n=1 Tax=Centruroides sculpturatus TaxID=218467 RepID=UPI000C6D9266|nr:uncharacterized protein LOC111621023 [Centruroides sculpturatus]
MLLTTFIVSLCFTFSLQSDASNLHQPLKRIFPTPSFPELNERFNIPPIIKPIPKPIFNYEKFGLINNERKFINKRHKYLQNSNPTDQEKTTVEYNFGNKYYNPFFNNKTEESNIKMGDIFEKHRRFIPPSSEYSILSMSSGQHQGTKLQPINTKTDVIPKQKNKGILQMQQVLNLICKNFREEFVQCGCERTCTNINGECTYKPCEASCYCRNGWVRDTAENCLPVSYYCKNPLKYSNAINNPHEIHDISSQESRSAQYMQLQQSSRLTPVQFNKPRVSIVCTLSHEINYLQPSYIYPNEVYDKLKRGANLITEPDYHKSYREERKTFQNAENNLKPVTNRKSNAPICNEDEVAVDCICERTCEDLQGTRCQSSCERGCVCKNGFVRIGRKCFEISACDLTLNHEEQKKISSKDQLRNRKSLDKTH